jgi:class 3 adenylate cyclase/tetratricopeptide (TPR) repeat protein
VAVCSRCGHVNPAGAKFCLECGAAFAVALSGHSEQRKTVTVLFCDVTGSTALGEELDPEPYRALLARYYERMKAILERHGGTVEKFIGDAVMAVFGIPAAHEDDALRALRAAVEMREVFPEVGVEGRIGIATGEVVTGTQERLATGDAVNVAKRLEATARPGEILLGEETLGLTDGYAEVEALAPLTLKGKRDPVPAYRLVAVEDQPAFRRQLGFVGRERELETLRHAWERVRGGRCCELVTVVGEAGIGKSRLVSELLDWVDAADEAGVVSGRCLPYGEGITYVPVVETIKQLGSLPSDPEAAAALGSLLGELERPASAEEIAWGFRRLLEERAQQQPLLCVFDDLQWGEETFLDLIEHLALLSTDAPILVVCMARPELNERHPGWPVRLRLQPLSADAVSALLPETLPDAVRGEIARRAAGNPLFITEMAAMATEDGDEVIVPPTLKSLVAARLDQLQPAERHLLQCAAVEGEIFHRGSLLALAPEEPQLTRRLASLVRDELVHPTEAQLPGDDAFRFHHLLFRDAAYESLPKTARAELHEGLAGWLEERGPGLVEPEEILGYHREQAARYKTELGEPDSALAERAGQHLAAAARRAASRGDMLAARGLLERALALTRPLRLDLPLELDLADTHDDPRVGAEIADSAADRARQQGDKTEEAIARLASARRRWQLTEIGTGDLEALARETLPLVERTQDRHGLTQVWEALLEVAHMRGRFEESARAAEQAIRYSSLGRAGRAQSRLEIALLLGPRPTDEVLAILDATTAGNARPSTVRVRALVLAELGRVEEAQLLAEQAIERVRELGRDPREDGWLLAEIAGLAGDDDADLHHSSEFCDYLEQTGNRGVLSTAAPNLGRLLCRLGRYAEAEPLAELGRELGDEQDFQTQARWRQALALVHSSRGEHTKAETLAREAIAIVEPTDSLIFQGAAFIDLSTVLRAAGRTEEAAAALEQGIRYFERKKILPLVHQLRAQLAALTAD